MCCFNIGVVIITVTVEISFGCLKNNYLGCEAQLFSYFKLLIGSQNCVNHRKIKVMDDIAALNSFIEASEFRRCCFSCILAIN